MYRPPKDQPRGAWALHLHEQRKARGLSATQAFELVYERLGLSPKSRSAYVAIDSGDRQPNEREAAILAEEFGWPPEGTAATESATDDAYAAAMDRNTAAIERQTAMLERVLLALGGLPDPSDADELLADAAASGFEEGLRRAQGPRSLPAPGTPARSPRRPTRDSAERYA